MLGRTSASQRSRLRPFPANHVIAFAGRSKTGERTAGAHPILNKGHDHFQHEQRLLIQNGRRAQLARLLKLPPIHEADVKVSALHSTLLL